MEIQELEKAARIERERIHKDDVCDTIHPKARWAYMKDLIPNNKD